MSRDNKERRSRGAKRIMPVRFLPVVLAMVFLLLVQSTLAAVQITSGTSQLSNTLAYGNTAYSVDYSYPTIAKVGTNLTISFTLHVISLTGLVEFITNYRLLANVFIGTDHSVSGSINSGDTPPSLYPGSTWGPNNVTIPLTAQNTGVAVGQSANATVSITLQDRVRYGGQLQVYVTEPAMQGQAGNLVIQNFATSSSSSTSSQTGGQSYLPYALLAAGAVLMLSAVFLTRGPRRP